MLFENASVLLGFLNMFFRKESVETQKETLRTRKEYINMEEETMQTRKEHMKMKT